MTGSPTRISKLGLGRSCFPRKRRKNDTWMTNKNAYRSTAKCKHIPSPLTATISHIHIYAAPIMRYTGVRSCIYKDK